jgi:transposase
MIRERVVSGIRTAQLNGKSLGRPRRVFRRDQARALRASGMSRRKIAGILGIPMSTVIDSCRDAEIPALPTPIASSRKPSQSATNQPEIKTKSTKNQPFWVDFGAI